MICFRGRALQPAGVRHANPMISLRRRRAARHRGQAMVEYTIMAGLLMASLAVMTLFLQTFKEYGFRILDLLSSEYP